MIESQKSLKSRNKDNIYHVILSEAEGSRENITKTINIQRRDISTPLRFAQYDVSSRATEMDLVFSS